MRKLKKWLSMFVLTLLLSGAIGITSQAGHNAKYAVINPNGDIVLTTYDHRKTSSVHYKTVGWTVTRCALGTKTPIDGQYFTIRFNDALEDVGDIWTTSDYMIPESQVMERIAAVDGSWLADVQGDSEQPCYLKFDAIMIGGLKLKKKLKKKNLLKVFIMSIPVVILAMTLMVVIPLYFRNGTEQPLPAEEEEIINEVAAEEEEPSYITETCYDGSKELEPILFQIPFEKEFGDYISNKEMVQKLDEQSIENLQQSASKCAELMYGVSKRTILTDFDNVESKLLDLYAKEANYHNKKDVTSSHKEYIDEYLQMLADNQYQAEITFTTDKSLIWFDKCYYVRGLLQLQIFEFDPKKDVSDYLPITFEKGKTYDIVVDYGFTTEVVNGIKDFTLVEVNYVSAKERTEPIRNAEYLEVK